MNKSIMAMAWNNAATAQQWHNKGNKAQYFRGALKMAHNGVNLKKRLHVALAVALPLSLASGGALGFIAARIILGA